MLPVFLGCVGLRIRPALDYAASKSKVFMSTTPGLFRVYEDCFFAGRGRLFGEVGVRGSFLDAFGILGAWVRVLCEFGVGRWGLGSRGLNGHTQRQLKFVDRFALWSSWGSEVERLRGLPPPPPQLVDVEQIP